MNKSIFGILTCSAVLVAGMTVASCSDDVDYDGNGSTGRVSLRLDVDASLGGPSRATLEEIAQGLTANDFTVRLTPEGAEAEAQEWSFNEFDGASIKTGTYTLEAYYGEKGAEGFDAPYFLASEQVTVQADRTTSVALTAALANAAVEVVYTDAFRQYMTAYEASVRTEGQAEGIAYPADANGELFVNAGTTSLYVTFTTVQGQTATVRAAEFTAEPRNKYVITVDVNNGSVGDATLSVTFDDSTVAETYELELSDELLNAPAPAVTPATLEFDVVEGAPVPSAASFSIMARSGMARVTMATEGDWLLAQGWPAEIDLLKADAAMQAKLNSLGLTAKGLWRNPDQMAVIDLTQTLAKIRSLDGEGATTRIMLEVEDKIGKVTEVPAVLSYTFTPLKVEIEGSGFFKEGDNNVTVELAYNGADPMNDVKWEYLTNRGSNIWDPITPISVTAAARSRAGEMVTYDVVLPVMVGATENYTVRASIDSKRICNFTIERGKPTFTLSATPADVWATHATVTVTPTTSVHSASELASNVDVRYSTDGTNWKRATVSVDGAKLLLSGLPAGSTVQLTGQWGTEFGSGTITTETPAQLPNAGMEDWSVAGSGKNWTNYVAFSDANNSPWGTNNPLTTSQGDDYAYCRATTTRPSTDAHSGTNCAWIRSQGWGSGNSAVGDLNSRKMKYGDAGLLHLGASRSIRPDGYSSVQGSVDVNDLACGYPFASRPAAVKFWYKYTPKNSADQGYAEYWIKDAAGNVLVSGTMALPSTGSWTEKTFTCNYPAGAAKAATIYVRFQSTHDNSLLTKDTKNFTSPKFANLSDGEYLGSQLFIDDIELTY